MRSSATWMRWGLAVVIVFVAIVGANADRIRAAASVPTKVVNDDDPVGSDDMDPDAIHFFAVDLYIDPAAPLAAYQLTLNLPGATIVGVEEGDFPVYSNDSSADIDAPLWYDPAALAASDREGNARLILADFLDGAAVDAPDTEFRVARVHLMQRGPIDAKPPITLELNAAGDREGDRIDAVARWELITSSNSGESR